MSTVRTHQEETAGARRFESTVSPCAESTQPLRCGGHSEVKTVSVQRVARLTVFLTFGVIALHQARLSNLYVEGFVLLVLFVVNYFHLDGFTEEEEGQGKKREGGKKRRQKSEEMTELENLAETEKSSISHKHISSYIKILLKYYFQLRCQISL